MESDTPRSDGESPDGSPLDHPGASEAPDPWSELHGEDRQRGWIPREDRLWLHPSEMGRVRGVPARASGSRRQRLLATGAVGAAAVTAALLSVVFLSASTSTTPDSGLVQATETSLTSRGTAPPSTSMRTTGRVEAAMAQLTRSVVELLGAHGTWEATAVVLPGGLAVTSSDGPPLSGSVWAIGPDGRRRPASVLGVDTVTGVAVLRVGPGYAPATLSSASLAPDAWVLMALFDQKASMQTDLGIVQDEDDPVSTGAPLLDTIDVEMPSSTIAGGALVDSRGAVVGILAADLQGGRADTTGEFVPAWFALDVARRLIRGPALREGWLGVRVEDAPAGQGVRVVEVVEGGPAWRAGLRAGDVIEDVDGGPTATLDDLRAHLYLDPPGTAVHLAVTRQGRLRSVVATLGSVPS